MWLGAKAVIAEEMTLGAFVAFNGYLMMLSWPMMGIGYVINLTQKGQSAMGRIQEIFSSQPDIKDGPAGEGIADSFQVEGAEVVDELSDEDNCHRGSNRRNRAAVTRTLNPRLSKRTTMPGTALPTDSATDACQSNPKRGNPLRSSRRRLSVDARFCCSATHVERACRGGSAASIASDIPSGWAISGSWSGGSSVNHRQLRSRPDSSSQAMISA